MANTDGASAAKTKAVIADAQKIALQRSTKKAPETSVVAVSVPETNTFAKIMLNSSLSPDAKKNEIVKALTYSKEATKEQNRAKIEEWEQFKEYLQEQRKLLTKEGIKLQDTEAFAQLQSVIDDMTRDSIDFQDKVKPLMDILDAVFKIRSQNKITDVYQEIQSDKEWHQVEEEKLTAIEYAYNNVPVERKFFGLGGLTNESKQKRNDLRKQLEEQQKILETGPASQNPDLIEQKKVLKEFLDLSKDTNRDRQKSLIDAAVKYVDTSDSKLKGVLVTLDKLTKHAEVMSDANGMLRNMHMIMDDSLKVVTKNNEQIKSEMAKGEKDESSIARMTREEKLNEVNECITLTNNSAVDIVNSLGGLTKHYVQIQSYKDTLRNESGSTKRLHLEGVSQMGEQLMSVISAISAAATTESRSLAADNFRKMSEQNQAVIGQEVIKNANNIEIEAAQIGKLVGELEDYGQILSASKDIRNEGFSKMRGTVDALKSISTSVTDSIKEMISDSADAGISDNVPETPTNVTPEVTPSGGFANPFDKLKRG